MALSAGTKLGSYEILQTIGAGGMGEVYKATDTRLGRLVAIKVLITQFSSQAEFKDRFEREAQTIAGLTHPHVCTLYDVGKHDGIDFLVMEFLEGETLAARLARGPLPLDESLRIAIQIADALDKAHTLGVTHRDLKPANIMLMKSGAKLMDFGLAKRRAAVEGGSASVLPTAVADLTQHGSIIGTVQYMAPEQVEGEEADPRTDIFAFGMVLYEMITGKKAFSGKSQASLMASILNSKPEPMSAIQAEAPPALQRVVEICLAKDPRDRWQTAHDVMLQLRWIAEGGSSVGLLPPVAHRRKHREWLAWGLAALGLAAAAALAIPYLWKAPADVRVMRFGIFPNAGTAFGPENAGIRPFPAISPDGTRIVFQAQEPNGPVYLWVRSLDAMDARKLEGTQNAAIPFWSPDGNFIAFTADNKLKKVAASGGPVQLVCDLPAGNLAAEGTWGPGGTILFGHGSGGGGENPGIFQVPDSGGMPVVLIATNKEQKETALRAPFFLPDGKHFLYLAQTPNVTWVGSLDASEPPKRLLPTESRATYDSAGYVLFVQQGNLMAQTFDAGKLEVSGTAFPIAENVRSNVTNGRAAFSTSNNGTLVYRVGTLSGDEGMQVASFDREGKPTPLAKQPGDNRNPRLSPDEKHLAMDRRPSTSTCVNCVDIWTVDLIRGTNTRITFNKGDARLGGWSADGTRLYYAANPDNGPYVLFSKLASGVGNE
jgi:Tol biopolymer transport system component